MKKEELLRNYKIEKLDNNTVFIDGKSFRFSYTKADSVVKDEFKGDYEYFGGLQTNYNSESKEHKNIEKWLCEIARSVLNNKFQ